MKKRGGLFASAIAAGVVAFAGKPAVATCLTQPNLQADGGHWHYRIDRATHRKCWYQQTPRTEARNATSSPSSSANSQPLPASPSSSDLFAWLSSISAAITNNLPRVAAQNEEARDARSAEPTREPSSRSRLRAAQRDRAHNRRANVEQVRAKRVDPDNSQAPRADSSSRGQDFKAIVQEFQEFREFQEFLRWKERQSVRW